MNSQIITVAADGSRASHQAFAWAIEEASRRRCGVQVVTAYRRLAEQNDDAARAGAEETAHATVDTEDVPRGDVTSVSWHAVAGEPVDVLVRASAHSTLLVMGSHSVESIRHNALGSVTDACARMSNCPVVVVGPAQRAGRVDQAVVAAPALGSENLVGLHGGRQISMQ
jgi:nucleotide-binding universal stress UspA family protein